MNGIKAYAFDVYGTLIDTNGVLEKLQLYVGEQASSISATWRAKQLEYSFRRGLMEQYVPFPVVTAQAFHYALAAHQIALNDEAIAAIIGSYAHLPAFPDAKAALEKLADDSIALFAFSNGPKAVVTDLLAQANILSYFQAVVSVELTQTFKPSPVVYQHFAAQAGQQLEQCALISGNPFDVLGAKGAGMKGIWVHRKPEVVFDSWEVSPDLRVRSLLELT
ncbi:MAG: haloacid dehalogenase type II [Bacteroidota bacterium]